MGGVADRRATYFFKIVLLFLLLSMLYCHLIPSISPIFSLFYIFLELLIQFDILTFELPLKSLMTPKKKQWKRLKMKFKWSAEQWQMTRKKTQCPVPKFERSFHVTMMILIRRNMQLFDKIVLSINNHTLWEWICEADNQLDKNVWLLHRRETSSKTCQFLDWAPVR